MIDSVFLLSVVTIFSGIVGLSVRYAFRSKCSNINCCWGLCQVERNIEQEAEIEQSQQAARNLSPSDSDRAELGVQSPRERPFTAI